MGVFKMVMGNFGLVEEKRPTFEEARKIFGNVGSTTDMKDCEVLYSLVPADSKILVDIGTGAGRSAILLALAAPKGKVYSIDNFKQVAQYEKWHGSVSPESIKEKFYSLGLNIELLVGDRLEFLSKFNHNIDFVFIDGGHQRDVVELDILNWSGKVRSGGIVCGHDYHKTITPGVVEAVDKIIQDYSYMVSDFKVKARVWSFIKR